MVQAFHTAVHVSGGPYQWMDSSEPPGQELGMSYLVEHLPGMHKSLGSSPALHELDKTMLALSPGTWDVEAGRSGVQGRPWLHRKYKATLGYLRPLLKMREKKEGKKWGGENDNEERKKKGRKEGR